MFPKWNNKNHIHSFVGSCFAFILIKTAEMKKPYKSKNTINRRLNETVCFIITIAGVGVKGLMLAYKIHINTQKDKSNDMRVEKREKKKKKKKAKGITIHCIKIKLACTFIQNK